MPPTYAQTVGHKAEQHALTYLQQQGHTIHHRNYRFQRGEIDIIAQQGNTLLFIEVKGRRHTRFGFPETFVTPQQQASYQTVATHYMEKQAWQGPIRFDIIAMTPQKKTWQITHLQDAFY